MQFIRDKLLGGVYNSTYEVQTDGGPKCASESTFEFKYCVNLMLFPLHALVIFLGMRQVYFYHSKKLDWLKKSGRGVNPGLLEIMQGLLCFFMIGCQLYFKYHSRTMIFILNPCHLVTLLFGIVSLMPFNRFSDTLFCFSMASCFGAWIGIVFAENGELGQFELTMYYVQHVFAAFLAPVILFLGGRYSPSDQLRWPLPYFGFIFFSIYMRYFLAPISAFSWANLNHTLCAVEDNDPWRAWFQMGKWYYLWSDFYLAYTSIASQYFIALLGMIITCFRSFTVHGKGTQMRQIFVGVLVVASLGSYARYVLI